MKRKAAHMNFLKKFDFIGIECRLGSIDPGSTAISPMTRKRCSKPQRNLARITELQRKLYADRTHSLLIVSRASTAPATCTAGCHAHDPGRASDGVQAADFRRTRHRFPAAHDRAAATCRSSIARIMKTCLSCACTNSRQKTLRYDFINEWKKLSSVKVSPIH